MILLRPSIDYVINPLFECSRWPCLFGSEQLLSLAGFGVWGRCCLGSSSIHWWLGVVMGTHLNFASASVSGTGCACLMMRFSIDNVKKPFLMIIYHVLPWEWKLILLIFYDYHILIITRSSHLCHRPVYIRWISDPLFAFTYQLLSLV